jgi:arylsulfatase A-like enzyme
MTGEYAHNHHVLTNFDAHKLDQRKTIQRYLQQAGYQTAITGKYLNHWGTTDNPPYFDKWSIFLRGEYYNRQFNLQGKIRRVHRYTTSFISDRAVSYLNDFEKQDDTPWYLYVGTGAPHAPFTPQPRYATAHVPTRNANVAVHEKDRSDKPRFVRRRYSKPRRGRILRRKQLRTLMSVDDLVRRVFKTMDQLDETKNTIALFVSDNGFFWGEHGLKGKGPPYTQGIQVPLMVRWPGHVDPGSTDDRLASTADIFPTLMASAGLSPDPRYPVDGRSLLAPSDRSRLLVEHRSSRQSDAPTWASDRTSTYQYIEYLKGGRVVGHEYYDLVADPDELHNLLGDSDPSNDPALGPLNRRLAADRSCAGSTCP